MAWLQRAGWFNECVAIAGIGGVTWDEALRMDPIIRRAFLVTYNEQQQAAMDEAHAHSG